MDGLITCFQQQLSPEKSGLKYVGDDRGQLDDYGDELPLIEFPCGLIDIQSAEYSGDGKFRQRGELTVAVKLYYMLDDMAEAGEGWQLYEKANVLLHGQCFLPEGFAAPVRTRMERVKRSDGIGQIDIVYTVGFVDSSCLRDSFATATVPDVKVVSQ